MIAKIITTIAYTMLNDVTKPNEREYTIRIGIFDDTWKNTSNL
jgi:hypothetical protein